MSWRTVVINSSCKLSFQENFIIVRKIDDIIKIHISEVSTIIVDTLECVITAYLINELFKNKIKLIFTNEKKIASGEIVSYFGHCSSSKKILVQSSWEKDVKSIAWQMIIKEKIKNQSLCLEKRNKMSSEQLLSFREEVLENDMSNREGHAAKVYFHNLFYKDFSRDKECDINNGLDYGYSILLSQFSKSIVSQGYITQLGIFHKNEFNSLNLACDLMEPFRVIIDYFVEINSYREFNNVLKNEIVGLLNTQIEINGCRQYIPRAIEIYVRSFFEFMEGKGMIEFPDFSSYEL